MNDDDEHGYLSGLLDTQRMSEDVARELRGMRITTGRISKAITDKVKAELVRIAQLQNQRIEIIERRQDTMRTAINRGLKNIVKMISGDD